MAIGIYIASVLGAVAVWLTLPRARRRLSPGMMWLVGVAVLAFLIAALGPLVGDVRPIVFFGAVALVVTLALALQFSQYVSFAGGLLGIATIIALMFHLLQWTDADSRPSLYYYIFTLIALVSAVRVISHPRPVYSALYFVMVVLATSGLFLLLHAEFMVFAMIIIYAGAILVTYMFVIMLATQPVSSHDPDTSPIYDRAAREPLAAVAVGFALIAVIGSALFQTDTNFQPDADGVRQPTRSAIAEHQTLDWQIAVTQLPGRALPVLLESGQFLTEDERTALAGAEETAIKLELTDDSQSLIVKVSGHEDATVLLRDPNHEPMLAQALNASVSNINRVGLNLFESHTLGIELAGVILLLSMVGAIVIARRRVDPDDEPESQTQT